MKNEETKWIEAVESTQKYVQNLSECVKANLVKANLRKKETTQKLIEDFMKQNNVSVNQMMFGVMQANYKQAMSDAIKAGIAKKKEAKNEK